MRFEDLIGQAILGDDQDKEDSMRRVSVKSAVMRAMFCQSPKCGRILDQRSAILAGFHSHDTGDDPDMGSMVLCPKCKSVAHLAKGAEGLKSITLQSWDEGERITC
jgi:hypothetical protein